jgi:hypothetical protein
MSNSDNLLARISESYRSTPGLEYIKETVPNAEEEYRIGFVKYLLTKEILPYSVNSKILLRSMGALAASTLSTKEDSNLVQSKNMTPNKVIMNAIKAAKNANANNAALASAWKPLNAWNSANAASAWNSAKPTNATKTNAASAWNSAKPTNAAENIYGPGPNNTQNVENVYGPGPNANKTASASASASNILPNARNYPTMYEEVPNAPSTATTTATTINASRAENVMAAQKKMGLDLRRASKLGGRRTKKRSRTSKATKKN